MNFITNSSKRLFPFIIFLVVALLATSCYYDNEEDLYPSGSVSGCDTVNVTYSQTIALIMTSNCNSCHSTTSQQGGVVTDNYTDLLVIANNGKLMGTIKHEQGYSPMPKGGNMISDCSILQIQAWINKGANND